MGNYKGYLMMVQCKDVKKTISVKQVKEFESSVSNYQKKSTFCVFVSNKKSHNNFNHGFSPDAIDWAKNSKYDMLLTNIYNLQKDLDKHKFKYPLEEEEIEEIKEGISDLNKKFERIFENFDEKLAEKLNEKLKEYDEKRNMIFLFLIIIIIILIIMLIFK